MEHGFDCFPHPKFYGPCMRTQPFCPTAIYFAEARHLFWALCNTAMLVHIYVAFSLYRRSVRKKSLCTPESTAIASIPRSEGFVRGGAEGAFIRWFLKALGQSLRHFLDKDTWWHFQSNSKEVIWPQIFLNYMHGLKSAILAIFQKGLGWPCPVSAALKNAS